MTKIKSLVCIICLFSVILTQTACKTSTFISTLNAVVAATEAAVATLGSTGAISPEVAVKVSKYLDAVATASSAAAAELATKDPPAEKARKIAEAFLLVALPSVPGLPPVLFAWLQAVDIAVKAFLVNFHPPAGMTLAMANIAAPKPSLSDRRKLAGIRSRAEQVKVKLSKLGSL